MPASRLLTTVVLALAAMSAGQAQTDGFDPDLLALTYHKVSGDPIDFSGIAQRSPAAARASGFDRPDVLARETERLEGALAAADPAREFTLTIDDGISEYDHALGEFAVTLFTPGYYVPVDAFGQQYRVVFANASAVRSIPMDKDAARAFDARLAAASRRVRNEVRFRVVGRGDPAGAVSGPLVVRAELAGVRILDQAGRVLFAPDVEAGSGRDRFDASKADVAGLRVGGRARDMEATLTRLFGVVSRGTSAGFHGFVSTLDVNPAGCFTVPGRRNNPGPGAVCVTAYLDADDLVRMIRVQRLFAPDFDVEVFRRALLQRYGPASGVRQGAIGWGPPVPGSVLNNASVTFDALTASYTADSDVMSAGLNRRENIIVTIQLVDAEWAARTAGGH